MGTSKDDRFNVEELKAYLKSIDNGGFEKLILTYIPGLRQFDFKNEGVENYKLYARFITELENSEFSEFFNF